MLSFVIFVNSMIWLTLAGPRFGVWLRLRQLEPEDVQLEVDSYLEHGQDHRRGGSYNLEDLVFNDLYEFKADISDKYCVRWQTDEKGEYTNIFRITCDPSSIAKKISPRRLVVYKREPTETGWVKGEYVTTIWCRGLIDKNLKRLHDEKLFLHKLGSGL